MRSTCRQEPTLSARSASRQQPLSTRRPRSRAAGFRVATLGTPVLTRIRRGSMVTGTSLCHHSKPLTKVIFRDSHLLSMLLGENVGEAAKVDSLAQAGGAGLGRGRFLMNSRCSTKGRQSGRVGKITGSRSVRGITRDGKMIGTPKKSFARYLAVRCSLFDVAGAQWGWGHFIARRPAQPGRPRSVWPSCLE